MKQEMEQLSEEWRSWVCSDCDPNFNDGGEDDSPHEDTYVILLPQGVPSPDYCPRCQSYLSMCEGAEHLRITNTPAERWAAAK